MTSTPWISCLLAAAIATAMLPAGNAAAALTTATATSGPRAAAEPGPLRLEVDVQGLAGYEGFDPTVYALMTRIALTHVLEARGYQVADPEAAAAGEDLLRLTLSWRDFDASVFEIGFSATPKGAKTRPLPSHLCEHCTDDDLVAMIEANLDEAIAALHEPSPEPPDDDGPAVGPKPATDELDSSPPSRPLGVVGKVGIGAMVTGVVGLVAGGVVLAQGRKLDDPSGELVEAEGRDFRPPGIAVLAGGAVLAVAGTVLLVVDRVHPRKPERSVRLVPTGPGVAFVTRF